MKEALVNVVNLAKSKFVESVDLALVLEDKFTKSSIRGVVDLPFGRGDEVKIGVFAEGEHAKAAIEAGADVVGSEDLIDKILKDDNFICDWFLATSDLMPMVARLSRVLGPKGLMPNPKFGTVTFSFAELIDKIRAGRIRFKSDTYGIIHIKIGNVKFSADDLENNLRECLCVIQNLRYDGTPVLVKEAYLSTTMGRGSVKLKLN